MAQRNNTNEEHSPPSKLRRECYKDIERQRESRVLCFVTSDRRGMETRIATDCISPFVSLLDEIGPTQRISLILHTNGGDTLAAWRIINLIRMFCDEMEVLIPFNALSAGTLIGIGADRIIMTKQAALGPIDPSVTNPLNPTVSVRGQSRPVSVSVENVRGYLDAARGEFRITDSKFLSKVLVNLTHHIHPLVLGQIFRTQSQIRFLARKLLSRQISDEFQIESIINFLCADSGSHDYTINRREADNLGLSVEKPSTELYNTLKKIAHSYSQELELLNPYNPNVLLTENSLDYRMVRGLLESSSSELYAFVSEGTLSRVQVSNQQVAHQGIKDERHFEGWRKQIEH